jgi:hypothetical protein
MLRGSIERLRTAPMRSATIPAPLRRAFDENQFRIASLASSYNQQVMNSEKKMETFSVYSIYL